MKPRIRLSLTFLIMALFSAGTAWAQANSHARIVRLSFVEGEVAVQRPDVQAWAAAPVNTPLAEGFKVSTGDSGFAEIELENGGTVRLGEQSLLDLTVLELGPDGGAINRVGLRQGYATFHPLPSRLEDSIQVETPYGVLVARGGSMFRVDLDNGAARVEVFAGSVQLQNSMGGLTVEKGSVLLVQPGSGEPPLVSQGITKDDWDIWVEQREAQMQSPPNAPTPDEYAGGAGQTTSGWNDLLQYGGWSNVAGEGYGWSPNLVPAGWTPYSTGQWCWYPGWGYTWIGTEPWGWLPYHYGGWDFVPGRGWVWFPGNLAAWSPAQVAWFHGPGWVGWTPRRQKDDNEGTCNTHCGGGVVSTSAFRNGGMLSSNLMPGVNPTSGNRMDQPTITPALSAKLTGPPISFRSGAPSGSTIVFDPQQNSYVNSDRAVGSTSPTAATASVWRANPTATQAVPVENRGQDGRSTENLANGQPSAAPASNSPRWGSAPHPTGSHAGSPSHSYAGRSAPSGSHGGGSSLQLSRGGNSGGGAVSGGGAAGGSHGGGGGGGGGHH